MVDLCWVEVYRDDECQTKLHAGYVDNASPMFEQLCKYSPWNEWQEVYMATPQFYHVRTRIYNTWHGEDLDERHARAKVKMFTNQIFEEQPKQILVIIQRPRNPYI